MVLRTVSGGHEPVELFSSAIGPEASRTEVLMARSRFVPNRAAFAEMAVGPEIRAALRAVGERAKVTAEALSQDFRITGEYADSFEVEEDTSILGRNQRAVVRLRNTAPYAAAVEWGNARDHRPHRVLGRTLFSLERP